MSGRARHLREGVLITNRKTDRRNPRLRPEQRPQLRFSFRLPAALAFSTRAGVYGFATVDPDGLVTVHGRERDFVLRKAAEFLKGIAHGLSLDPIDGVLFCPGHPGPTAGSPDRPGYSDAYQIIVTEGAPSVTVVGRTVFTPIVIA